MRLTCYLLLLFHFLNGIYMTSQPASSTPITLDKNQLTDIFKQLTIEHFRSEFKISDDKLLNSLFMDNLSTYFQKFPNGFTFTKPELLEDLKEEFKSSLRNVLSDDSFNDFKDLLKNDAVELKRVQESYEEMKGDDIELRKIKEESTSTSELVSELEEYTTIFVTKLQDLLQKMDFFCKDDLKSNDDYKQFEDISLKIIHFFESNMKEHQVYVTKKLKFGFYNEYYPLKFYKEFEKYFNTLGNLLLSSNSRVCYNYFVSLRVAAKNYDDAVVKIHNKIGSTVQDFMPISDKHISLNDIVTILQDTTSKKEQTFCDKYKDDKFNFNGKSISTLLSNEESVEKYMQSTFKNAMKMILSKTNINSYATQQTVMKNAFYKNQSKSQDNYGKPKFTLQSNLGGNTTTTRVVKTKGCECRVPGWIMLILAIIGTTISGIIAFIKRKRARSKSRLSTVV